MYLLIDRRETLDGVFFRSKVFPSSSSPSEVESLESEGLKTLLCSVFFMMDAKDNYNPSLAKERDGNPKTFLVGSSWVLLASTFAYYPPVAVLLRREMDVCTSTFVGMICGYNCLQKSCSPFHTLRVLAHGPDRGSKR